MTTMSQVLGGNFGHGSGVRAVLLTLALRVLYNFAWGITCQQAFTIRPVDENYNVTHSISECILIWTHILNSDCVNICFSRTHVSYRHGPQQALGVTDTTSPGRRATHDIL